MKKEFIAAVFDSEHKVFIVHVASPSIDSGDEVNLLKRAQIVYLKVDEAFTKISSKYADFVDIFLSKLVIKIPKHTKINDHTIKLVDDWQPLYGPIYSLGLVKLEISKAYIKNNLINSFIKPLKSPARAPILFNKKSDRSLKLCVNYWCLHNLTIKNWYPLFLFRELLDWLG